MNHDSRFDELTFDDFRRLAVDTTLSPYEKIGFPDAYRRGYEHRIFADLEAKLPALGRREQIVLDIGPGCSELPTLVRRRCDQHDHMVLVDSEEMLAHHPDGRRVRKFSGSTGLRVLPQLGVARLRGRRSIGVRPGSAAPRPSYRVMAGEPASAP